MSSAAGDAAMSALGTEMLKGESSSSGPPHALNALRAARQYFEKILKPKDKSKEISGMKSVLLDKETKNIVGMVYAMHEFLEKEVYYVGNLDAERESSQHLKAIVFVRPIPENLRMLKNELMEPKFAEYHLFFSNIVSQDFLRQLAEADIYCVVQQVQEFYADFHSINADLWALNVNGSLSLSRPKDRWGPGEHAMFERTCQGIVSNLLAFKMRSHIRYQGTSRLAQALTREVTRIMGAERELFGFKRPEKDNVLLILDRKDDPVTPLLSQWTYQAMLHELIGIRNNRVDLNDAPGVRKDMKEITLTVDEDEFYREHMYSNYGDLGAAVKSLLNDYQATRNTHANVQSIEDIQNFVDSYPELRQKDHKVGKHVALMSELTRRVEDGDLFEISETEQSIACSDNPGEHYRRVCQLIDNPKVSQYDALRVVILFALRYETSASGKIDELRRRLLQFKGLGHSDVSLIKAVLQYGGVSTRGGDLFGNKSMLAKLTSNVKRGLKGVENVFTQHEPLLVSILDQLRRNKLSKALFPSGGTDHSAQIGNIVVFIVGGATYEEALKVAMMNAEAKGNSALPRIILGSTAVHNSKSFLAEMARLEGALSVDVGH